MKTDCYEKNSLPVKAGMLLFGIFIAFVNNVYAESRGIGLHKTKNASGVSLQDTTYRALIIGNNDYRRTGGKWPRLKTAISDASALRNVLRKSYNFTDIRVLKNATRRDVLVELKALAKRVKKNDSVLVYYAGHGYLDDESQQGYWVPVDAKGLDQTTFLRNSTIRDELTLIASRGKHTLLIADSCFSGSLLRSGTRGISTDIGTELYYQKVANKKSVQIMTAGGVEYVDDNYKSSGHSPFTYFLLNELKTNNRALISMSELSTNVQKAVANNVDQVPESGVLHGAGDELGEFVFIKVDVKAKGIDKDKIKVIVNVDTEQEQKIQKKETQVKPKRNLLPLPTM
ncbi:MAG: caspase family protein [Gammaproteobacteria bacterium]|nr:caspase family protein [Gammaproteobacteria bacterium]